jgi:hypothetical protein
MTSRRDSLGTAAAGSDLAAGGLIASRPGFAAPETGAQGGAAERTGHYVPPIKFGLGGVTLGNEFEVTTDEDAYGTLDAAWSAGVRYYDVAPGTGSDSPKDASDITCTTRIGTNTSFRRKSASCSRLPGRRTQRQTFPSRRLPTTSYSTTRLTACAAQLRTVCSGSASAMSISCSCMTSHPTTSCCRPLGSNSSRSPYTAHSPRWPTESKYGTNTLIR